MSAMALRLVYYAASRGIATLSNLDMQQCPKTFCNNVQKYFAILSKKCLQKTFQESFGAADHITVEKVERTTTEDLDGNSKTEYAAYLVSDVNLKKESDHTEDYSASLKEEQMDDSLVKTVDFEEGFGFSYEGMDGRQVFEKLLETSGVDGDLNQAVYDKETYEMTKEKTYVLKNPCSVLEKMLQGTRYDELLENKVFYQTTETEDGKLVPDSITAVVQYRSGDETVTKSLFLQVSINNWRETEE